MLPFLRQIEKVRCFRMKKVLNESNWTVNIQNHKTFETIQKIQKVLL